MRVSLILIVSLSLVLQACAGDSKVKDARTAGEKWLDLNDSFEFHQTWSLASDAFRKWKPRRTWVREMTGIRKPLEYVNTRDLKSEKYTTELPRMGTGEFVVIEYITWFHKREHSAVETLTMKKGADGWRVAGYTIR